MSGDTPAPLTACLDTSFLVDVLRGDPEARRRFRDLVAHGAAGITPVTLGFLYLGAFRSRTPREVRRVRELESLLQFLPFRPRAGRLFGRLMARLRTAGEDVGAEDGMIAAIALDLGLRILTRDVRYFSRVAGLRVETY